MADDAVLNAGVGGITLALDDIAGVHHQRVKVQHGADGSATDVSSASPLPIGGTVSLSAVDNAVLDAIAASVAGTLTVGLPTGAASAANQATIIGHVDGIETLLVGIDADTAALAGTVAGTEVQVDIVAALPAGANIIGVVDLGATDNAVLDTIEVNTSPAVSHYRNVDANAEAEIKGSAAVLHWMHCMNLTAAKAYVHLYDQVAASVTPGTTVPTYTFPLPTQGDTNGAGFNLPLGPNGQAFATGLTIVVTTTVDGAAGDPGTNGVFVNAGYT